MADIVTLELPAHVVRSARTRLNAPIEMYRRELVRKVQAWKVAVARGLRGASM